MILTGGILMNALLAQQIVNTVGLLISGSFLLGLSCPYIATTFPQNGWGFGAWMLLRYGGICLLLAGLVTLISVIKLLTVGG